MIKRRFIQLAKVIEASGRFNLNSFVSLRTEHDEDDYELALSLDSQPWEIIHNCNTTGCVAGWINAITRNPDAEDVIHAGDWLGITEDESEQLFYGYGDLWDGYDQTDANDAGRLLRALAAGTVQFKDRDLDNWKWVSRG